MMIYLIQDEWTLNINIGCTTGDPLAMVELLAPTSPGRLRLIGLLEGGHKATMEVRAALCRWRVNGTIDWFRPGPPVLALLCESPSIQSKVTEVAT